MPATINQMLAAIHRKHGDVIVRGTLDIPVYPTGSFLLDRALGIGGLPVGRFVELYGAYACGKTTLALHASKSVLDASKYVLFLDYEHALSTTYAHSIGINIEDPRWILAQPDSLEQGADIADKLVSTGELGLVVVDSLAAMIPQAEIESGLGEGAKMQQARGISQFTKRLLAPCNENHVTLLMTNHEHEQIDFGMKGRPPGPKRTTTPGGVAPKFWSSVRIAMMVIESVKSDVFDPMSGETLKRPVATKVRCLVTKNKCAMPYRDAVIYIWFGRGIYETPSLVELGVTANIIIKSGGIYKLSPDLVGEPDWKNINGARNLFDFLDTAPEVYQRLRVRVLEYVESFDRPMPEAETQVEGGLDEDTNTPTDSSEVGEDLAESLALN